MTNRESYDAVTRIIMDAGGEVVGRTKLQKIAVLLKMAGFDEGFSFGYHYYGPYSGDLAQAIEVAKARGAITEERREAGWGGKYSIFSADAPVDPVDNARSGLVKDAAKMNAIKLELAATAAYLSKYEGFDGSAGKNPWEEVRRRKPQKSSDGRLNEAAREYATLADKYEALPRLPEPQSVA